MEFSTVTVNDKVYMFDMIRKAGTYKHITVPCDYVNYFGTRNGKRFGPVRQATAASRPGTVGHAVFAAAEAAEAATAAPVPAKRDANWGDMRTSAERDATSEPAPAHNAQARTVAGFGEARKTFRPECTACGWTGDDITRASEANRAAADHNANA